MAARERYLERPDEQQRDDHGADRDAYDDVGIPEYDEGNTRDDMMFPEDDVAQAQMAAAIEVEGDREASASMPPMPMDDRTLDDVALDDDPAADQPYDDEYGDPTSIMTTTIPTLRPYRTARRRHSRPHRSTQTVRQHQRKRRSPICRCIVLPQRRRIRRVVSLQALRIDGSGPRE